MRNLGAAFFGVCLLTLTACQGTGSNEDPYYGAWFDIYGNPCSYTPRPGCDYYSNGMKITVYQDPYYSLWLQDHSGFFWTSPTGIIYDQNGFAINADREFPEENNDVITSAAEARNQNISEVGKRFADQYGLNVANATQVAKTLNEWATLGKSRAKTETDIADFSRRLFGISPEKISAAILASKLQHSLEPFGELNSDVAAHWGTTPETSKLILKKWYQGELSRF